MEAFDFKSLAMSTEYKLGKKIVEYAWTHVGCCVDKTLHYARNNEQLPSSNAQG